MRRALPLAALLGSLLAPSFAAAHMGSTKSLDVQRTREGATVLARVDTVDAAIALGLGRDLEATELEQHAALLSGWLTRGIALEAEGRPCIGDAKAPRFDAVDTTKVSVELRFACPSVAGLVLRDDTVFAEDPDHEVFVTSHQRAGSTTHVLRAAQRSVELDGPANASQTAGNFVREGVIHLVTGYDHLLFLLSLILIAALASKRDGLEAAVRDIAWLVTAFTLGHSISLVGAALGWVTLPTAWVEAAIAASIVFVAAMNVARPEPPSRKSTRLRNGLAAGFGLIHGFGFSSVLADVGLPEQHRVLALLSFNVGIELGQIAAVLALMLPLAWWAHRPSYRRYGVQAGSFAIAACGCLWLVERTVAL